MKKIVILLLTAVVCSCSAPQLVILHVNDTHSHLEPVRSGKKQGRAGIIERGAIVDSVRQARGQENVLLLHAGDFNQGTSYFTIYGGDVEVEVVNAFKYDCVTLGNHEFDNGVEDLARRLEKIECPIVCANIKLEGTALEGLVTPYTIVHKAGKKIGIIGLVSNLASNVSYEISSKLVQYDNTDQTNKYADYLKKVEKCDLVILLSHLGFSADIKLVPRTTNVDIVVGGHSHTTIEDIEWVKNANGQKVAVVQDGEWGYAVGELIVK